MSIEVVIVGNYAAIFGWRDFHGVTQFPVVTPIYPQLTVWDSSVDSIRAFPDREPTIPAIYCRAIYRFLAGRNEARYCPGVTPKRRAKVRRRISALLKPLVSATSSRLDDVVSSFLRAASSRRFSTCRAGVSPTSRVNTRAKLRGLIAARRARDATDSACVRLSAIQASKSLSGWLSQAWAARVALNCD